MVFEMTDTEAKVIWKMQKPIQIDELYIQLKGELSRQYLYHLVKTMSLKEFVNKSKVGKKVKYMAKLDAVKMAEKKLREIK
jgi:predicted transcriptional regulator